MLLYGYGAYGVTIPASFSTTRLSLVDRGFVYAIAHVRGGKDKGFHWYADGRREKKVNTFTGFRRRRPLPRGGRLHLRRADRRLGRLGRRAADRRGRQHGAGTLRRADRRGAVRRHPQHHARRHPPLTPPEWPEWGNPIVSEADFRTILAYSPYDNVAPLPYPAILALGGLTDPRVTYWEPAKWVAKLRDKATGNPLILLRTNMDAGPRRCGRPLRPAAGDRLRDRLRPQGDGEGVMALTQPIGILSTWPTKIRFGSEMTSGLARTMRSKWVSLP